MISHTAYGGLAGTLVADLRSVEVCACFVTRERWNVARDFHGRLPDTHSVFDEAARRMATDISGMRTAVRPVQTLLDVHEDPQAQANGSIVDFDHPLLGKIRILGYPVSFSTNTAGTHGPAPDLGEHTVEVLSGLGYSSEAIDRLRTEHIVR
jgi:crotonobetainyl-CoA:carnitine CoA-transferase CaiB-like acyl-CoA transferase